MRKHSQFLTGIPLLVCLGLHAQVQLITGKVTDATGSPIPAVLMPSMRVCYINTMLNAASVTSMPLNDFYYT